ncbi:thioredoxin domain-containing protein [Corynebacterium sp. TAE3-ERU2]|uniref:DsbA family protein n=1 Tax=Corynebacterium sp. TAE3-ERU2 TaxID=2849497 RepID=UPI001C437D5F|nr:DsbA family protein [Corynebacterium sp. TAE3-ERU2]
MSNKIKNPNDKGSGFLWALVALLVVIAVVVGYIVVQGRNEKKAEIAANTVNTSINLEVTDNAIRLTSDKTSTDAAEVDLYEDYSCPHCADLAKATDEDMLKAIEDGTLVVNIRSLNFLDRGNDGPSSKAATSAYTLAKSGTANEYWNFRSHLMNNQKAMYSWEPDQFAAAAGEVGADKGLRDAIADQSDREEYSETSAANRAKLEEATGRAVSSPHVIHNGEDLLPNDNWVKDLVG